MINQYKKYYSATANGVNPTNFLVDGKFNDLEILIKNHIKDISGPLSEKDLENKERKYFSALSELLKNFLDGIQEEINDPRDVIRNSVAHLQGQSLGFSLGLNYLELFIGSEIHIGTDAVRNRIVIKNYISSVENLVSILRQSNSLEQEDFLLSHLMGLLGIVESYLGQLKKIESSIPAKRPWFLNAEYDQKVFKAAIQIDRLRKIFSSELAEINQQLPNKIIKQAIKKTKGFYSLQISNRELFENGSSQIVNLGLLESEKQKQQCLKLYFGK